MSLADEFREKGVADLETARREHAATLRPNYDAVCFHAQQCVEKLMKAVLAQAAQPLRKTHSLLVLDAQIRTVHPTWHADYQHMAILQVGAVEYRYPGITANKEAADLAMEAVEQLSADLLKLLGHGTP